MSNFIPYPFFHDDVPIDISFVFENEKPAGKHGFLKVAGRNFVFEDGSKVRFWGTNFNGAGCFPDYDYAKKLAKRLAKIGINLVRFHQLDSQWQTPNIFSFTKGKRMGYAHLDPESMDRLDYLIKCLKDEGIYIYMDMFTYRKFRSDEGVENVTVLPDAAKPYNYFVQKLIDLQKEFATELWTHLNKYTNTRYCDEPAIVLAEVVNEGDIFQSCFTSEYIEPFKTEFSKKFEAWLKEKGIKKDISNINFAVDTDHDLLDFKEHLQKVYYLEIIQHLRNIGVKIPITGTNWTPSFHGNQKSQLVTDFLDSHSYFYDWSWQEFEKKCMNRSITQEKNFYLDYLCYSANINMPTYISEWDVPWPNEFRADSVLYTAAFGMFQGWSGFAIHTYSYSTHLENKNVLGKEIMCEKIGNIAYRPGVFSTWNDPAKFGLFYHAALITRRGDVRQGDKTYAIKVKDDKVWDSEIVHVSTENKVTVCDFDCREDLPELTFEDNGKSVTSETGELFRDYVSNYGKIDTPLTKCAFGFLEKQGEVKLNGMKVKSKTDYAVIAVSSLTDDSLDKSDNILLTAVGRAQNTDAKFFKEYLLDLGKPPVIIECIEAEIELDTIHNDLIVWAISPEGYYIGTVPTSYENGKMKIKLGETSQSMYYLISKQ